MNLTRVKIFNKNVFLFEIEKNNIAYQKFGEQGKHFLYLNETTISEPDVTNFYWMNSKLIYSKPEEGTFLYDLKTDKTTQLSNYRSRLGTYSFDKLVVLKKKNGSIIPDEYIEDLNTKELKKIPGPGKHFDHLIFYSSDDKGAYKLHKMSEFRVYDKNKEKDIHRFSAKQLGIELENEKKGLIRLKTFHDGEGRFVLNFNNKKLWKLEVNTGELTDLTTIKGITMPRIKKCVINGFLYCLSNEGLLIVIDIKTNDAVFFHLEDHFKSHNLIPGGALGNSETHLFFSSVYYKDVPVEHSVAALNLETKKIDWVYQFDPEEIDYGIKSPVYKDGRLYVKSYNDNTLHIFEHANA